MCKKITNFNKNRKKCFKYFSQTLTQKNVTKMLRKISRTHRKISRIFVNKFGQAGVYVAIFTARNAGTGGCAYQNATQAMAVGPWGQAGSV
jgi:hypothetical protein